MTKSFRWRSRILRQAGMYSGGVLLFASLAAQITSEWRVIRLLDQSVKKYSPDKTENEVLNVADTTLQVDCDSRKVIEFLNDLDEPKKEWQLFLRINKPQHECWKERLERWCLHFAVYQAIDSSPGEPIRSMFTHLTVLDGKFSLALTINSFILTATTFLVTHVSDLTALLKNASMKEGFQDGLIGLSGVIGFFSLLNMWNCLKGVRRVVWGDLGHWITAERASNNLTAIVLKRRFLPRQARSCQVPNPSDCEAHKPVQDRYICD